MLKPTVKIGCNNEFGSGFIYIHKDTTDAVYIFTARHCITGRRNEYFNVDHEVTITFSDYNAIGSK